MIYSLNNLNYLLSLMTTMTQLFKIVTSNDYEALKKIIQSKSKADFNCVKSRQSLLQKAIEVRAKECFDLLIEIPNLEIIKKGGMLSGIQKALEYYIAAPNPVNEYYVNVLLEKNITIESYTIISTMDHPQIFNLMFNQVEKTENIMHSIIEASIRKNNINMMYSMFSILDGSNIGFYNDPTRKAIFNDRIFSCAICHSNNDAFNFLINRGYNWKEPYALLYYLMNHNTLHIFNAVYHLYESLSIEELNQITHIKNLVIQPHIFSNDVLVLNEYLNKIFKLPIQFNDCAGEILKIFIKIMNYYYYGSSVTRVKQNLELIITINKMYKAGIIKTDPFYNTTITEINVYYNKLINRDIESRLSDVKQSIRHIVYVCVYYNPNLSNQLKEKFNLFFTPELLISFDIDKNVFVESLNQEVIVKVTKKVSKTKAKPTTTTKANTDIEV